MGYDVNNRPGAWVLERSAQRQRRMAFGFVVYFAISALVLVLALQHRMTLLDSALFLALALSLRTHAGRYIDEHIRWLGGARAEEAVGELLNALRYEGWTVMHDITPDDRGNVDHIVSGPGGVFLIETKQRSYLTSHLSKVKRQAARLHDALGVWVTPVICLHERQGEAFKAKEGVDIVPSGVVVDWLRGQHRPPVEFERLARFADSL